MSTETAARELETQDFDSSPKREGWGAPEFERLGATPGWRRLLMQGTLVAPHLRVAAIEGEQGVGKQTLARYLHARSPLAQAEFRHRDAREWLATEADLHSLDGFLYLERADLLATPGQSLLLGVLKAMQDRPIGRAVLVASSESSLRYMAARGLLMPDLALRLTAVRFAIPPLRQRREDIAPLAQTLLEKICARYRHRQVTLASAAMTRLLQHTWPGNVRELESVLEAALLEMDEGVIRPGDLPLSVEPEMTVPPHPLAEPEPLNLEAVVQRHVRRVLELNRGNKLRAARQLGISRSTLYRMLDEDNRPDGV